MKGRPLLAVAAAAASSLALAACLEVGLASSVAFPPDVPGLDAGQPWLRLPVDAWVTEGGIEPVAIAACFASSCSPPAAVGLFRARGTAAERLAAAAAEPQRLVRALLEGRPRPRSLGSAPRPKITAAAEPLREAGWRGFTLHMARQDGSRPAYAAVLTRMAGGAATAVVVVAAAPDAAQRLAREVAARQG
ncbi:hypothetical protein [Enterovirga aerilata]|uniref:Uncharacterized protein n=1 Tax=Enterovirga aerilata TaxID=2730920 RepID=A0A849IBS9_9HYPH|nr:hypothetical protein [Enterovirga sp. DB1703]NNM73500.1 hypothetical protein [Enterovirga sp. DB1703]